MRLKALFPLLFIALIGCARSTQTEGLHLSGHVNNIIGGSVAKNTDPISDVTVKFSYSKADGTLAWCSGTMIASHAILTAAHCAAAAVMIYIYFPDGTMTSDVLHPEIHPQHSSTSTMNLYDFAILKFKEDVEHNRPYAELPSQRTEPRNGAHVFIAGYGFSGDDLDQSFRPLKKLSVKIKNINYSPSQIEVREPDNSGACHGDSGGPGYSLKKGVVTVWGIDSQSAPEAPGDCINLEIYSRVQTVKDWIESVLAE